MCKPAGQRLVRLPFRSPLRHAAVIAAIACSAFNLFAHEPPAVRPEKQSHVDQPIELPPLPAGIAELKLADLFEQPIGPRGLIYTKAVLALEGKKVRVLGYMVKQEAKIPGLFLLAPLPLQLHEEEFGLADDLPAATLHVHKTEGADQLVPFTPGPMLLTGTLRLGNREEADGRISSVRLELDPPAPTENREQHNSKTSAPENAGAPQPANHTH